MFEHLDYLDATAVSRLLRSKWLPVKVDQLLNIIRKSSRTGLAYTPVNYVIVLFHSVVLLNEPLEKALQLKAVFCFKNEMF